eukprot:gnl/TRDRNA2_/TRDRNA2_137959_c0_seq4.p1 gnl/TRDRNA2_/TRDRNA2_137959_c0~~gnl/TRDRNA2_/TRDRNA2_137959_c0_seq4.p1  ORF type:complete len:199 (+),score=22.51 gnl/TRDRNA2_/TRDRNA2_137959_c0_seq4:169-765(+)
MHPPLSSNWKHILVLALIMTLGLVLVLFLFLGLKPSPDRDKADDSQGGATARKDIMLIFVALGCAMLLLLVIIIARIMRKQEEVTDSQLQLLSDQVQLLQYACPATSFGEESLDDAETSCSICLLVLEIGDVVRTFPCPVAPQHIFHKDCIDSWMATQIDNRWDASSDNMLENVSCPICRRQVAPVNADAAEAQGTQV